MPYRPGDPARTRQLIAALAASPEHAPTTVGWAGDIDRLIQSIRGTVASDAANADNFAALSYEQLSQWRNELDRLLGIVEREEPLLWMRTRVPGTWLDSLLRLRSVLTHVVSKAYWSARTQVRYAEIEIERYLWGAR